VSTLNHDRTTSAADADAHDVALAAGGDGRAFERLYRRHVARVHSVIRRMIGMDGAGGADDITQDVFVRAWHKLATFRGEAAFGTWLFRLAVNVILEHRSALGRERARREAPDDALERAASPQPDAHLTIDFESAISRLPEGAREVFVLHDVEGYKHEEIAAMLGIVPGTSKSQLHHARMALRAHLDP
jgi:RNA polymerase sigma factor (sigma-70 family)